MSVISDAKRPQTPVEDEDDVPARCWVRRIEEKKKVKIVGLVVLASRTASNVFLGQSEFRFEQKKYVQYTVHDSCDGDENDQ